MASTYKTGNYNLNKWISSDIPEMADFNHDNDAIDSALHNHCSDEVAHITSSERDAWNDYMGFQVYYGDGKSTQTIDLNVNFTPRLCLVFPKDYLPGVSDFVNKAHYHYFGVATTAGSVTGITLDGKELTVMQSTVALAEYEYRQYNQKGQSYIVIAIR